MIILLTGPTGVGKTDTSWAIVGRSEHMVFLDCDWFASYAPFSWQRDADVEAVYEAISLLLGFHRRRGARRFVVPLTIEMAFSFDRHRHHFDRHGLPLCPFRLRCRDETLLRRIAGRDRIDAQKQAELAGALPAQRAFDGLSSEFRVLDTSALDADAVAGDILASAAGSARVAPPRAGGR